MKAAIYTRISQDREGLERGVDRQEADCRKLAKKLGWDVAEVYSDNDISATSGRPRPSWNRLMDDLEAGTVDAVLAYSSSRMYRRLANLSTLLGLAKEKGIQIETVASGKIDLTTADGRMLAGILASVDQAEAERIGERVRRTKASRRDDGRLNGGGRRAFGYRSVPGGLETVPEEAALIREACDRVLAGETLNRITTDWNDRGIPTAGGDRWRQRTLKRVLVGNAEKRGTPLVAGGANWDAILTADEVQLLNARLTAPSKYAPKNPVQARRYALTGLLKCGGCGHTLRGSGGSYRCLRSDGGCGKVSAPKLDVERFLDREVQALRDHGAALETETPFAAKTVVDRDETLARLRAIEVRIEELADELADTVSGSVARRVTERAIEKLAAEDEALRASIAADTPNGNGSPDATWETLYGDENDLYARWDAGQLTDTEVIDLRAMFGAYLESATIADLGRPAPRGRYAVAFDTNRIHPVWKVRPVL